MLLWFWKSSIHASKSGCHSSCSRRLSLVTREPWINCLSKAFSFDADLLFKDFSSLLIFVNLETAHTGEGFHIISVIHECKVVESSLQSYCFLLTSRSHSVVHKWHVILLQKCWCKIIWIPFERICRHVPDSISFVIHHRWHRYISAPFLNNFGRICALQDSLCGQVWIFLPHIGSSVSSRFIFRWFRNTSTFGSHVLQ